MDKNNQNNATVRKEKGFGKNRELYINGVAKELPSGVIGLPKKAELDNYDPPVCIGFSDSITNCDWNHKKYHLGFYVTKKSQDRLDKDFPATVEMKMLVYGTDVCFGKKGDIANCTVRYSADSGKILKCSFTGKSKPATECEKREIENFIQHIVFLFGEINFVKRQEVLEKTNEKELFTAKKTKGNQKSFDESSNENTEKANTKENNVTGNIGKQSKRGQTAKPQYKVKYWIRQNLYKKNLRYKESCICSRHCLIVTSK